MSDDPDKSAAPDEEEEGGEMTLVEHLVELRNRLVRCVIAVLVLVLALFPFANDLYTILAEPLLRHMPEGASMIATEVASPFLTPFKLTVVLAIFVAMPVILYQACRSSRPGCTSRRSAW